jgi:phage/plasmid-like protein (TIGR03299 family)
LGTAHAEVIEDYQSTDYSPHEEGSQVAHELFIENGKASMFYVGEVPWHELGTRLETPPASSAEAIQAAGLDWEVVKAPLYISGTGRLIRMPDRFAMVRKDHLDRDDCPVFGFVGREYEPLQNLKAFRFFDPLLQDGTVTFETAGALGRGERVWVLARLGEDIQVGPDALKRYLLLSNRHDGTGSVLIKFTPIRVVCQNTLSAALRDEGRSFRIRHDRRLGTRLRETGELLQMILRAYEQLRVGFEAMRAVTLNKDQVGMYLASVFPDPQNPTPETIRTVERHRTIAAHFYREGSGNAQPGVQGTLWAAYNGVAEYIDHRKPNVKAGDYSESRLKYVWFGGGATIKQRALVNALRMADVKILDALGLQ